MTDKRNVVAMKINDKMLGFYEQIAMGFYTSYIIFISLILDVVF